VETNSSPGMRRVIESGGRLERTVRHRRQEGAEFGLMVAPL
jgi:hypothetical protein